MAAGEIQKLSSELRVAESHEIHDVESLDRVPSAHPDQQGMVQATIAITVRLGGHAWILARCGK